PRDEASDVLAFLYRGLRHAWKWLGALGKAEEISCRCDNCGGVANDKHVRATGNTQIRIHFHPTRFVRLGTKPLACRRSNHACRPQYRPASNTLPIDHDSASIDTLDLRVRSNVNSNLLQMLMGPSRELLGIRRENSGRRFEQENVSGTRID